MILKFYLSMIIVTTKLKKLFNLMIKSDKHIRYCNNNKKKGLGDTIVEGIKSPGVNIFA
jgi:hypothetical protein